MPVRIKRFAWVGDLDDVAQPDRALGRYLAGSLAIGVERHVGGDQLVRAAFARVAATDSNLQGYWTLDETTADLSRNNNPVNVVGQITYEGGQA